MRDTERAVAEHDSAVAQLEELHEEYKQQWRDAVEEDDEIGAVYASGKLSGLIAAQEAVEDAE